MNPFTLKKINLLILFILFNFAFSAENSVSSPLEEDKAQEIAKEIADRIPEETVNKIAVDVEEEITSNQRVKQNCCQKFINTLSPRAIVKAITWRITGTVDTVMIAYILTNHIGNALAIGSVELITKFVLYYLHERVWGCISWRRNNG